MHETEIIRILKNINSLSENIDYQSLTEIAEMNLISELLYRSTSQAQIEIPQDILSKLQQTYHQTLAQNLLITAETEPILKSMTESNIKCIILKGVPLAERLYGDIGLRRSSDIDILVEASNIQKAASIILAKGYMQITPKGMAHHLIFKKTSPHRNFYVELHFHITPRHNKAIIMQEFWHRATPLKYGETVNYQLSSSDLILYLCLHSAIHGFNLFRYIVDVARAVEVEGKDLDWDEFVQRVKDYGLTYRVYASLYYAKAVLDADIPDFVLKELAPPFYLRHILESRLEPGRFPKGLSKPQRWLLCNEGIGGLVVDIKQNIFPTAKDLRLIYNLENSTSIWRYYPKRWKDLFNIHFLKKD